MAQQNINLGTIPNQGTDGDDARTAFQKSQDNFTELYLTTPTSGLVDSDLFSTKKSGAILSATLAQFRTWFIAGVMTWTANQRFNSRVSVGGSASVTNPGRLTVSDNTVAIQPSGTADAILHVSGPDSGTCRILVDSYNGAPAITFRTSTGTATTPTAIVSNQTLGVINALGRSSTAYSTTTRASMVMTAAENWNDSAQGAYLSFFTTQTGTVTQTEKVRISGDGSFLVGTTSPPNYGSTITPGFFALQNGVIGASSSTRTLALQRTGSDGAIVDFIRQTTLVGSISVTASATTYNTSSDYRLKQDVQPLSHALERILALKPSTYQWKSTNEYDNGFVAHELQKVIPQAVTGVKDAVDGSGNPVYQGVDNSKLVPILVKAIQELKAEIEELKANV